MVSAVMKMGCAGFQKEERGSRLRSTSFFASKAVMVEEGSGAGVVWVCAVKVSAASARGI
jgi:hypothetical protein